MTEYGLPTPRDSTGRLKPVDHTYDWGDHEVTIKLIPPTISQQEDYEELGTETSSEDLREILEDHLVEPDISEMDLTARELLCYVEGIVDYSVGDARGMAAEVQEELEARQSAGEGN